MLRQEVIMPILDAALAFSLTMLVVASTVTLIVSVIRNFAASRAKTLRKMLEEYLSDELKPMLDHKLNSLDLKLQPVIDLKGKVGNFIPKNKIQGQFQNWSVIVNSFDFVETILSEEEDMRLFKRTRAFFKNIIVKIGISLNKLSKVQLSTEDLLAGLKKTQMGDDIVKVFGDEADKVFDTLGKRYEAIGARFTESFRKRSQLWTTIVALVLAVVLNIDSIFILDSYIKDESLRQGIIAQMDVIVDQYTTTIATIPDDDNVTKETLQQSVDSTKAQVALLKSSGFPIGPSYFPHDCFIEDDDKTAAFEQGDLCFRTLNRRLVGRIEKNPNGRRYRESFRRRSRQGLRHVRQTL